MACYVVARSGKGIGDFELIYSWTIRQLVVAYRWYRLQQYEDDGVAGIIAHGVEKNSSVKSRYDLWVKSKEEVVVETFGEEANKKILEDMYRGYH